LTLKTARATHRVRAATVLAATLNEPVVQEHTNRGGSYGAFLRFAPVAGHTPGLFLALQNPFMVYKRDAGRVSVGYAPDMDWRAADGPFVSDRVCVGPYALSGSGFPRVAPPQWIYLPHAEAVLTRAPELDLSEWRALTDCVRAFLIHPAKKSVRLEIGWCENDYQIDVATPSGVEQERRIIEQSVAVGCPNVLFTPANNAISSKADSVDAWAWENILWLGLGQKLRKGEWAPERDPLPPTVGKFLDFAREKGARLAAYVYPSLKFRPEWNAGDGPYGGANSANRDFQDWLIEKLLAFQKKTGVSGYSFDYWWLGYKESSAYAQWYGCRRILESLREKSPDIIIDGRQSYHYFGPWTWLGGSYPHPTTTDEQPASFRAFPDLHVDRVYGNHQRWAAYWYAVENFCPVEILPGFMTHQTQRFDAANSQPLTDFRTRDWDYLGWKYSVISSIGTAPMNHVLNYLPARDPDEFAHFAAADKQWWRDWMDWTDRNRDTLSALRPILGPPAIGAVDGTAAIHGDRGFVFLYNPNLRTMTAEFALDATIGLTAGTAFALRELHPNPGVLLAGAKAGLWRRGETVKVALPGASAMVLEIVPMKTPTTPLLLGSAGDARLNRRTLALAGVRGPVGHSGGISAVVPANVTVDAVTVNGAAVAFQREGNVVRPGFEFAGTRFDAFHAVIAHSATFTGGAANGEFTIPGRIQAQLRARKAAWPIPYTADDLKATWLSCDRLLLFVQIADPKDTMAVGLTLDGNEVPLQKAYTSIYGQAPEQTFVGWYADVSALAADVRHTAALALPALAAGQFQGLYFDNVETEFTASIHPATA
jgi:hypothetical protein